METLPVTNEKCDRKSGTQNATENDLSDGVGMDFES